MKQRLFTLLLLCIFGTTVFAGGIVTNSNQSAQYVRMLARDASTSIDAVYYNPAGLTKMENGFHISLSNQSVFQKKTIENTYVYLNEHKFVGDVVAPLFPDFYAVYKKDKIALSFGFQPNAGGGSAEYQTGLPSFEMPVSSLKPLLSGSGITTTEYSADINFKGSSVFWGAQVNASYEVNDMISLSAGVRMIFAKNTYTGYLKNIMINPEKTAFNQGGRVYDGINMVSAPQFFTDAATVLTGTAAQATSTATSLGAYPAATPFSALPQTSRDGIMAMLAAGNITTTPSNVGEAISSLNSAAPVITAKSAAMSANAANTADKEVDSKQTGTGYTPIFGANITLGEKLNVGIRYEFRTKLTLENDTKIDGTGQFVDGAKIRNDIPAIFSVGVGYKALPQLRISGGMHYYFDKDATIEKAPGVKKDIEGNLYEVALGGEYDITDKILISAGYLYAKTGVGQGYQTDLSHSLTSSSVGFGGQFKVTDKMALNLGMLYTMYTSDAKEGSYQLTATQAVNYKETYNRTNIDFSIGIDYHF